MASRSSQPDLFTPVPPQPAGLRFRPDLIDAAEEAELMRRFAELPFEAFDFHGFKGHRRVIYFGWRYDFSRARIEPVSPIPEWITPLRERVADLAGRPAAHFVQLLINQYRPGAGIGWHRDRPQFGVVAGVSLGAPAEMRFRRDRPGGGWDRALQPLPPRSAYVLEGPARDDWLHSIRPGQALRYSATFRTLRKD